MGTGNLNSRQPLTRREALLRGAGGAALFVMPGVLYACGGDGNGGGAPRDVGSALSGDPRRGGSLRVAFTSSPGEPIDPPLNVEVLGSARIKNFTDSLFDRDADYNVVGRLVEDYDVSDDATRWTLKLRSGVRFHDGSPLRPEDVLASMARYATGLGDAASQLAVYDPKGSRKIDASTVELRLKQPRGMFDETLADTVYGILPESPSKIERPEDLIGTGPFKVAEVQPGRRTVLVANEDYWEEPPFVDELILVAVNEPGARMRALRSGQVDVALDIALSDAAARRADKSIQIAETAALTTLGWIGNLRSGPFSDPKVVTAFKHAIDREALVKTVLFGYGVVGNDVWGAGSSGFDENLDPPAYDPELAKRLLSEAGASDLKLAFRASAIAPGLVESTTVLREQMRAVGVTLEVNEIPPDQFLADFGTLLQSTAFTFSTPQPFLEFYEKRYLPDVPLQGGWDDVDWQKRFEEALATTDKEARNEILRELQPAVRDRAADFAWGRAPLLVAASDRVRGLDNLKGLPKVPTFTAVGFA